MPDVVLMETVRVVRRQWSEVQRDARKLKVEAFGLADQIEAVTATIQERIDGYEEVLLKHLHTRAIEIAALPGIDHLEIAERAAQGRAPYSEKKKDGYRDTLIWLTLLAEAGKSTDDVWFVSDNTQDFAPTDKQGSRNDCPIPFHDDLATELQGQGLLGRVQYVASLEVLERHLAAERAPIADDELHNLVGSIDLGVLAHELLAAAENMPVDSAQVALPVDSDEAMIVSLEPDEATWTFTEGARRGGAAWTATFSVVAQVDVQMFAKDEFPAIKLLKLTGGITVEEPSTLAALTISDVTAMPNELIWMKYLAGVNTLSERDEKALQLGRHFVDNWLRHNGTIPVDALNVVSPDLQTKLSEYFSTAIRKNAYRKPDQQAGDGQAEDTQTP